MAINQAPTGRVVYGPVLAAHSSPSPVALLSVSQTYLVSYNPLVPIWPSFECHCLPNGILTNISGRIGLWCWSNCVLVGCVLLKLGRPSRHSRFCSDYATRIVGIRPPDWRHKISNPKRRSWTKVPSENPATCW